MQFSDHEAHLVATKKKTLNASLSKMHYDKVGKRLKKLNTEPT
jgi:hypothetical protein